MGRRGAKREEAPAEEAVAVLAARAPARICREAVLNIVFFNPSVEGMREQ
jgi:hypothetical protein